jgi:hypothetical protein
MPVRFQKWITRQDLKNNPDVFYVFGDNVNRVGLGGQAKEMRGEPNAIGVATKWAPGWDDVDFFKDDEASFKACIGDLATIIEHLRNGRTVIFPSDGLGTGLSMLPQKAPQLYQRLYECVYNLSFFDGVEIPWEKPK